MGRTIVLEVSEHDARELLKLVSQTARQDGTWRAYWQRVEKQLQADINRFYEQLFAEFVERRRAA